MASNRGGEEAAQWDASRLSPVLSAMKDSLARSTPPPRLPALHNLNAAAHLATVAFVCLGLGAALGVALAVYLRRRGLAWTWGVIGLAPIGPTAMLVGTGALGARAAITSIAFCLGAASASIGWGLYWQLEDRRAGGDRESAAAERRGLLDSPAASSGSAPPAAPRRWRRDCRSAAPPAASSPCVPSRQRRLGLPRA